jgi:ribonucleases P/MRP protein subunit RPP40
MFHPACNRQVDSIFTDYRKAFDRIDHKLLLQKLLVSGIHGNLYRWFSSYIHNRTQAVTIHGFASNWNIIPSGVPQGSLLGPLLFNLFINDISACFIHSHFLLYADDMKIFRRVKGFHDCHLLQQDLGRLEDYCKLNKLDLNISKCHSITFSRKPVPTCYKYALLGIELEKVSQVRDLGVIHDSKLTYDKHIDHIVNKAYRSLGFMIRSCSQFSNIKIAKILYCSYVRSCLEYCSQVWYPQYGVYINRLETIQRKFLRYLQFKCKGHEREYTERCRKHHILPLVQRRQIADIVTLVKIAQSIIDSPHLLSLINLRVPNRSTRRHDTLIASVCNTNYRNNSFFIRSVNSFNKLVDTTSLDIFNSAPNKFKQALGNDWFNVVP